MFVCYPMKCEWEKLNPAPLVPWPTPVHTSFMPAPQDMPDPVSDLAVWARCFGWNVRATYAEGWVPGQKSEAPKKVWAVRCSRESIRAIAIREDGSWRSFWVWSNTRFFTRISLLDQFKQIIAENTF